MKTQQENDRRSFVIKMKDKKWCSGKMGKVLWLLREGKVIDAYETLRGAQIDLEAEIKTEKEIICKNGACQGKVVDGMCLRCGMKNEKKI